MLYRKKKTDKKSELNNKVNSNGFALFVVGLTVAGFLGGAMRLFLNSEHVQAQMMNEVRKKLPGWEVDASLVQLHLASGIWPGVTLDLPRAKLIRREACQNPSLKVEVNSLRVPVSLWSVVSGKSKIGRVSVEHIDVEVLDEPCAAGVPAPGPVTSTSKTDSSLKSTKRDLGFRKIYEEVVSRLEGLNVSRFTFSRPKYPDWSLNGQNIRLNSDSRVDLKGDFSIWKMLSQGETRQHFNLHAVLTGPLLEWELLSTFKEGSVAWLGQLDDEGKTFLQRLRVKQGPIGDLLDLLYRAGVVDYRKEAKRVWLNCELIQSGKFEAFELVPQIPIRLESCRMDGEIGQVVIAPQVFYAKKPYLRNGALSIEANALSLDLVAEILNLSKLSVVFSHLGNWTGTVEVQNPQEISINGILENMRLNVSNKSLRGVETLSRIETKGSWSPSRTHLILSDFQILGGSRGGSATVDLFPQEKRGFFKVSFDGLSPSEPIQGLLFQGRTEPLKLHLDGHIQDGKVIGLRGEIYSSESWGRGWRLSKTKASLKQMKSELFAAHLDSALFQWDSSFKYQTLAGFVRTQVQAPAALEKNLKDVRLDLKLFPGGGEVQRGSALWSKKKFEFTGNWRRGGNLHGRARLDKSSWVPVTVSR